MQSKMCGLVKQHNQIHDENTFVDASSEDIWAAFEQAELALV